MMQKTLALVMMASVAAAKTKIDALDYHLVVEALDDAEEWDCNFLDFLEKIDVPGTNLLDDVDGLLHDLTEGPHARYQKVCFSGVADNYLCEFIDENLVDFFVKDKFRRYSIISTVPDKHEVCIIIGGCELETTSTSDTYKAGGRCPKLLECSIAHQAEAIINSEADATVQHYYEIVQSESSSSSSSSDSSDSDDKHHKKEEDKIDVNAILEKAGWAKVVEKHDRPGHEYVNHEGKTETEQEGYYSDSSSSSDSHQKKVDIHTFHQVQKAIAEEEAEEKTYRQYIVKKSSDSSSSKSSESKEFVHVPLTKIADLAECLQELEEESELPTPSPSP